jgi:hypothetical protein
MPPELPEDDIIATLPLNIVSFHTFAYFITADS